MANRCLKDSPKLQKTGGLVGRNVVGRIFLHLQLLHY